MKRKIKILVVGSFVMDMITTTAIFPNSGETVLGESFTTAPGGKGANQCIQAARLGADVTMVGRVGKDAFGDALIASMKAAGVNTEHVMRDGARASAVGNITLESFPDGGTRNRIIVVPGANMAIAPADVAFLKDSIAQYDMVMMQFEIPMEINVSVAQYARDAGVPVMVNPAPAAKIPEALLACATYLSPNEHEAAALAGLPLDIENGFQLSALEPIAKALLSKGVKNLLITLGGNGAALINAEETLHMPALPHVKVADPTAAGDSFVAAFCVALCAGLGMADALDFARSTAAITVANMGAQPSLPALPAVLQSLRAHAESFDFSALDCLQ